MSYNEDQAHIEILLIKKQLGDISSEEVKLLETLLTTNPEAAKQSNWFKNRSSNITDIHSVEVDQKWATFQKQLQERTRMPAKRKRLRSYSVVAAAAVLGLLLLSVNQFVSRQNQTVEKVADRTDPNRVTLYLANGGQMVLNQTNRQSFQAGNAKIIADNKSLELKEVRESGNSLNILEVPRKLDYKITLSDGTTVHLNSASVLKFPFAFNSNTREVYLNGEGYFTIAKKSNQPFIVHTVNGDIQVLGTEFNVNTYTQETLRMGLINGSVKVSNQQKEIELKPGDYLTWNKEHQKVTTLDKSILSWRSGVYYFRNTSFREIVDMIPRWFDVKVIVDNDELYDLPFTGQLDKLESLESFLKPIQYTSGIKYTLRDNVLRFSK